MSQFLTKSCFITEKVAIVSQIHIESVQYHDKITLKVFNIMRFNEIKKVNKWGGVKFPL